MPDSLTSLLRAIMLALAGEKTATSYVQSIASTPHRFDLHVSGGKGANGSDPGFTRTILLHFSFLSPGDWACFLWEIHQHTPFPVHFLTSYRDQPLSQFKSISRYALGVPSGSATLSEPFPRDQCWKRFVYGYGSAWRILLCRASFNDVWGLGE